MYVTVAFCFGYLNLKSEPIISFRFCCTEKAKFTIQKLIRMESKQFFCGSILVANFARVSSGYQRKKWKWVNPYRGVLCYREGFACECSATL